MPRRRKGQPKQPRGISGRLRVSLEQLRNVEWAKVRRAGMATAWFLAAAALVAAWAMGVPRLLAFASQHRTAAKVQVRFLHAPAWFKDDLAAQLTRTAEMQLQSGDPFRRDELLAVRKALLESQWFDTVHQVRRVEPGLVEIDARFVRPYAVVRDERGDHLVDSTGKLLPKSYPPGAPSRFMAISGVRFQRPQPGMQWEGADVVAGLRVLKLVESQSWRRQVRDVDVSEYLNDGPIRIRTDAGSDVVWGGPPGEEPALEVLADEKLRRLQHLFDRYGRIDGGHVGEIDITDQRHVATRSFDDHRHPDA